MDYATQATQPALHLPWTHLFIEGQCSGTKEKMFCSKICISGAYVSLLGKEKIHHAKCCYSDMEYYNYYLVVNYLVSEMLLFLF